MKNIRLFTILSFYLLSSSACSYKPKQEQLGDGDDVQSSNAYYHWEALLGMIQMIENNQVPKPLSPLN